MSRSGFTALVLLIVADPGPEAAAAPPGIAFPATLPATPVPTDPFPIRRVFLPPNRVPDGMGSLIRMRRDEFEQKVRAASDALRHPPRIAAAHYTATLSNAALIGTAEWTIRNPGGRNGLLALDPHRLALDRLRWADGTTARLSRLISGDATPKTFAWLDGANAHDGTRLQADWSLRATDEAGESRFELRVPPAGIAILTVTLPQGLIPRVSADDALVTGPTPADDPAQQRWRIAFGGRNAIDLVLTRTDRSRTVQPGPVKTVSRLVVGEGQADGTYRFELDPTHEPGDAYVLDVDDRVIVQSVAADVPIDWKLESRPSGTATSIRIVPREAGRISRFHVTVAATPPVPGLTWAVPTIRLRHALPAETTIHLKIASDLRPVRLDPGDFRLSEVDQSDRGRNVTWTSTLARPETPERTWPSLVMAMFESSVSISERATFVVTGTECFLRVAATVTSQRGPVSTFTFTLPEGYRTTVVPSVAGDSLATVHYEETKPARWVISLSRPLATGQTASISFALAMPHPVIQKGILRIAVPAVVWPEASRSGSTTVSVSTEWTPISPLVVAYQDLPPAGDLFIREARPVAAGDEKRTVREAPRRSIEPFVTERPELYTARIGDRTMSLTITGVTGLAGVRTRISLPSGSTVRAVQLGNRAIDHPHVESGEVILPAALAEAMPYEIQVVGGRTGAIFERLRVAGPDGPVIPIRWQSEPNWLVATWGNGETAYAVRREVIAGVGWVLAAGLLIPLATIVWTGQSRQRSRMALFVTAVACGTIVAGQFAGSAFVPPLVVSLAGLLICLARMAPTVAVAAVLFGVTAEAAAPQPVEVYLMYGMGEESQTLFAFAPKTLLERLDQMAGIAEPDLAILSARYLGTERPDEATVQAHWSVHVPPGGPHRLNVPLSGVKLESVSLDGTPAFPEPLPAGGFSLALPNRGTHVVSATFAVPVRTFAREREIRFSGPDVALATLAFTSNNAANRVDVISRRGRQFTAVRDGQSITNADLGEGRFVTIRWRQPDSKPVPASTDATVEAAVWDVEESEATLLAAIQFPANHGPDYRIRVPVGLSLVRAVARPVDGGPPLPIEIHRGNEMIRVTPRQPVEGKCTVVLTLVPERPVTAQTRFAFPRAVERPDPLAVYAIRLNGLVAAEFGRIGVIDVPADAAARTAIPFPELNLDTRPATRAYRRTAENVELTPRLSVAMANPQWTCSMTWTVGARADVLAEWQCSGPLPGVLSFALPPALRLASLRGPDVIDSTFADGRHSLWLRTGDDPGPIRIVATLAHSKTDEYALPVIRPPQAEKILVRIRPAAGYSIRIVPATGVSTVAEGTVELAPGVDSLRVAVTSIDPPQPTPPIGSTMPVVTVPAVTPPPVPVLPEVARFPRTSVLLWLGGMMMLGLAFARPFQVIRPELILAWGVLAWVVWSPIAAIGVVLGVAMRIGRSLRESPSPAR